MSKHILVEINLRALEYPAKYDAVLDEFKKPNLSTLSEPEFALIEADYDDRR